MFDTIADMLRGSAPDDLAHALGTDRTQTRRAMEIGLPALITGLRDKTLEPGGAQNLASMLDDPAAAVPSDLGAYLAAGDPSQGAAMLDVAFGDRGEPALAALSSASGLSTRLLAQVMSVLAPLATGTVAAVAERSPEGLRRYLAEAVADLEGKGFGRVVELVSPAGINVSAGAVMLDLDDDAEPERFDAFDDFDDLDDLDDLDHGDLDHGDAEVGTVVAGVFPESADEVVMLDDLTPIEIEHPTEAHDMGDSMPDFDLEVANVSPAGVAITSDDRPSPPMAPQLSPTMTLTEPAPPAVQVNVQPEELERGGLSGMGWLWWLIGAVLGIVILLFAITQCGGSDGEGDVATGDTDTTEVEEPTPDPLVVQRQATLDGILVNYPNVQGEVFGEVAVLSGTVADETERALLDQAVRAAGLGVQNNVIASEAPVAGEDGYSISDQIDVQPELSTLKALLTQAGLGDALAGGGEFTLFAPTNDAFAAVSDQLAQLQDDPDALRNVLRYHLLVGAQDAAALGAAGTVPTQLEGQSITVDASSGTVILNGSVQVLTTAAPARNGVMHIVSGVLLPSTAAEFPEEIGAELGLAPITFALGSAELTDEGMAEIDKVVAFLLATPGNIEIGGHTDSDGDTALNQSLSQDRADAVKDYMEAAGIPVDSMTAVGYGEEQPIAPNDTAENKALNRRIEFRPV